MGAYSHFSPAQVLLVTVPCCVSWSSQVSLPIAPASSTVHTWTLQKPGTPWLSWLNSEQFCLFPSPTETRVEFFQRLSIGKAKGKQSQK